MGTWSYDIIGSDDAMDVQDMIKSGKTDWLVEHSDPDFVDLILAHEIMAEGCVITEEDKTHIKESILRLISSANAAERKHVLTDFFNVFSTYTGEAPVHIKSESLLERMARLPNQFLNLDI